MRLVDERLREDHAARFVVRVRQRQEAGGPGVALLDLVGRQRRKLFPRHARGQLHAHAVLHGLAARHRHAGAGRFARSYRAVQQVLLPFGERRLLLLRPRDHLRQRFSLEQRVILPRQRRQAQHHRPEADRADGDPAATARQLSHLRLLLADPDGDPAHGTRTLRRGAVLFVVLAGSAPPVIWC